LNNIDVLYHSLLKAILESGNTICSRNSTTKRLAGFQMSFTETPLVSLKHTAWKNAIREFEWFLSGSSNINDLHPSVHHWWKPWANLDGEIPNGYGKQLRRSVGKADSEPLTVLDQIAYLIDGIKNNPYSRRNVITTWNTAEMVAKSTNISNCHGSIIQSFVDENNNLELVMYQRSSDVILGLPHNLIQYWAFLLWLASETGTKASKLTWVGGDCHIYQDHWDLAQKLIDTSVDNIKTPNLVYTQTDQTRFIANDFSLTSEYKSINKDAAKLIV
jgi:thymidylate synthase